MSLPSQYLAMPRSRVSGTPRPRSPQRGAGDAAYLASALGLDCLVGELAAAVLTFHAHLHHDLAVNGGWLPVVCETHLLVGSVDNWTAEALGLLCAAPLR